MLNFKSLKTHLGLTYLDGRAVASGPFIRTSLRCCRGLLGWRHYFSLPYLLGFCPWFWFSLLFGVRQGNNCSQLCSQDHWALLNFWLEVEFLLGPIDGELNFSGSNINMCLGFGMTLTLATKSHIACSKCCVSMEQSMVGHPGSFFFSQQICRILHRSFEFSS